MAPEASEPSPHLPQDEVLGCSIVVTMPQKRGIASRPCRNECHFPKGSLPMNSDWHLPMTSCEHHWDAEVTELGSMANRGLSKKIHSMPTLDNMIK